MKKIPAFHKVNKRDIYFNGDIHLIEYNKIEEIPTKCDKYKFYQLYNTRTKKEFTCVFDSVNNRLISLGYGIAYAEAQSNYNKYANEQRFLEAINLVIIETNKKLEVTGK